MLTMLFSRIDFLFSTILFSFGRDEDDKNFPIAWACVKNDSKFNWSWFLTQLQAQLEMEYDNNYTLIFDMHKVKYAFKHHAFI